MMATFSLICSQQTTLSEEIHLFVISKNILHISFYIGVSFYGWSELILYIYSNSIQLSNFTMAYVLHEIIQITLTHINLSCLFFLKIYSFIILFFEK